MEDAEGVGPFTVEGYIDDQIGGGVAVDTVVPSYTPLDGALHIYLLLILR